MFAQVQTPDSLTPEQLDDFLLRGWFRMGQNIFTTNFLNFKGRYYSAIWLRVDLGRYTGDSTGKKLRKLNAPFQISIGSASITEEKEELFGRYRQSISFEASASLHQLLFGKAIHDIYDTREVTLRMDGRLVACGFFDIGLNSAAGITSFYDPEFRKHSLGKYLIYLKIDFCREAGLQYFYPGYFVPGYSFFDYKLSIGKQALEYLDFRTDVWLRIDRFNPVLTPIHLMEERLNTLHIALAQVGMSAEILRYEFFEASLLPELKDIGLFDYPMFVHYPSVGSDQNILVVVYDVREGLYHVMRCRSVWNSTLPNVNGTFSSELLKEDQRLFSSPSSGEVISALAIESRRSIVW